MSRSTAPPTPRSAVAEGLGTALLLAMIVGSGTMAERLASGNVALALLANSLATGFGLAALILAFGSISGAHFNPVVTLSEAWSGERSWPAAATYVAAQIAGALLGVAVADAMFQQPLWVPSTQIRAGAPLLLAEAVATFGLLFVIRGCSARSPAAVPFAVGAYIVSAYWFTSSTSFANPAVTVARSLTDTFAGIRPADAPGFIAAQLTGAIAATWAFRWLSRGSTERAESVVSASVPELEGDPS